MNDYRVLDAQRFAELADAYGGDLSRWPEAWREPAARWLRQSPDAAAVLDEAAALDAMLHALPAPQAPPPELGRRIVAAAPQPVVWRERLRELWLAIGGIRYVGPALAASLVLGVLLAQLPAGRDSIGDAELSAWLISEPNYQELVP